MALIVLVLDVVPDYVRPLRAPAPELRSLLLAPLATGRLVDQLAPPIRRLHPHKVFVLAECAGPPDYATQLSRRLPGVRVVDDAGVDGLVAACEPGDDLLVVDARHCAAGELGLERLVRDAQRARQVVHAVASAPQGDAIHERVVYDDRRELLSVRRLYDGVTRCTMSSVVASCMSLATAQRITWSGVRCANQVRTRLARHPVAVRDVGLALEPIDLATAAGLLQSNTRLLRRLATTDDGIHRAATAQVAPDARIVGPAVIQAGARVEAGACIVGPVTVAENARVERGAFLSNCVVFPDTVIAAGADRIAGLVLPQDEPVSKDAAAGALPAAPAAPPPPERRRGYELLKGVVDRSVAAVGLALLSPLLLFVAAAVRLTSRGPALFGHLREGLDGRPFRCLKFRTMVRDADAQQRDLYEQNGVDGPQFKLDHDPRITRLGRWLRRTNIDELPQLINVLRGEMSLIGPRPSPFRENQRCIPWRKARLSVRPGITGLWQVCRSERGGGDFHQWILFDSLYVRHLSAGLDLRILLATFVTLSGRFTLPVSWLIPGYKVWHPPATGLTPDAEPAPRSTGALPVDEVAPVNGYPSNGNGHAVSADPVGSPHA